MGLRFLAAALFAISMATTSAQAAPQDAVLNKAGIWGIDVDGASCAASMTLKDVSIFLLRGV